MTTEEELEYYKKAYQREKLARKEAEQILEEKAMELFSANENLRKINFALGDKLEDRIKTTNQAERRYRQVIESASDIIYQTDLEGNFTQVNAKAVEVTGFSQEDLVGKNFLTLVDEKYQEKMLEEYRLQLQKGEVTTYLEYEIITKDGGRVWLGQNVQIIYDGFKPAGFFAVARDMTDRITVEQAIKRSEEKYRGILENLEFGLLEVNTQGIITKAYPSFCNLTGFLEKELLGRDPYELLHPDFHELMNEKSEERVKGVSDVYEVQIKKKSGGYKWVIISGAPFYNELGDLIGSIGVHLDITNRKLMEDELKAAKDIAQASSQAKELFLANMSHEIRTPLNAVIGLSNMLGKTSLDGEQQKYLANLNNSAKGLLLLVNDILDFTKIDRGKLEICVAPFELNNLVEKVCSSGEYMAKLKGLNLTVEIDDRLKKQYVSDELRLCQVLINLIGNAIKFTEKGEVTLRIERISESQNTDEVKISVEDTGKGIIPEALPYIFDDFTQESSEVAKEYGGTGLGLSISQKLVHLLDSELKVKSQVGKGTKFYFSIQLVKGKEQVHDGTEQITEIDWSAVNILVVEDNPVNQFVIQSTIRSWGGEVTLAGNGEHALDRIQEREYDIILMDLQMPVMDGVTTTKIIRNKFCLNMPIIAFTATAIKKELDKCYAAGMNDYVTKPFDEMDLKMKMITLISDQKSKQEENPSVHEKKDLNENDELFVIDKVAEMANGDNAFVLHLLNIFLEDCSVQLEKMRVSSDADLIRGLAHKMKPSIDYVGSKIIRAQVREIEQRAFEKSPEKLDDFLDNLELLIQEVQVFVDFQVS